MNTTRFTVIVRQKPQRYTSTTKKLGAEISMNKETKFWYLMRIVRTLAVGTFV